MDFRAAVLHEVGRPLIVEQITLGDLRPRDVLVRVHASGLCHTDLEVIEGALAYPLPIVLGHEGAGVVEAVGAEVSLARPGDHVVCSWNPHCGHCFYCDRGEPILCEVFTRTQPQGYLLDGTSRLSLDSRVVRHFSAVSSHAEHCVVHETSAIVVPRDIPFDRACLLGCGVMTGVGAVTRIARVAPGATALVIGTGAVGLNAVQGARFAGAGGREATFRLAVEAARPGATVAFLGKVGVDQQVAFRWGSLMAEKRLIRSSYGGARPRRDFTWLARQYLEGRLKLDELITQRLPLEQINDGFVAMAKGNVVRAVLSLN